MPLIRSWFPEGSDVLEEPVLIAQGPPTQLMCFTLSGLSVHAPNAKVVLGASDVLMLKARGQYIRCLDNGGTLPEDPRPTLPDCLVAFPRTSIPKLKQRCYLLKEGDGVIAGERHDVHDDGTRPYGDLGVRITATERQVLEGLLTVLWHMKPWVPSSTGIK